ncbi:major capsid protein [Neisseria sp. Dent CA1/247]|uniref:major capsid protein n=1 Tax=Neisseria sp. Dent CA1/247 TaxID=2912675 RepID=UPI001FD4E7BA|nr:major capsid protein [Neisseria sp. Dent CA1/247]UOO78102.1 major capsid protein [Neisseria sp. Dent CA1/247]
MKIMNIGRKYGSKAAVVFAAPFALAAQAWAALPDGAKQAIEGAKADGLEAGWLVVGVFAALFVIAIVKRLIR